MRKALISGAQAASCFFRSSVLPPHRKALLQITERCNLHCAHCFVSAGDFGDTIPLNLIETVLLPRLVECRVVSLTLTGGEPFVHPDILAIVETCVTAGLRVGICTNATNIPEHYLPILAELGVHVNVSLDGFRAESHGKFRGDRTSFTTTLSTIQKLGNQGLLQGILTTPNALAKTEEYAEICDFAALHGAQYVLMNPLSAMGRGIKSQSKLCSPQETMRQIELATKTRNDQIELVHIRFPNDTLPLAGCDAGNIVYIFVHGELVICPYLVFAAKSPASKHKPEEFTVSNIFEDPDIADKLDHFNFHERYKLGGHTTCASCSMSSGCGKGCPAAVVASGQKIGDGIDFEVCPNSEKILPPTKKNPGGEGEIDYEAFPTSL